MIAALGKGRTLGLDARDAQWTEKTSCSPSHCSQFLLDGSEHRVAKQSRTKISVCSQLLKIKSAVCSGWLLRVGDPSDEGGLWVDTCIAARGLTYGGQGVDVHQGPKPGRWVGFKGLSIAMKVCLSFHEMRCFQRSVIQRNFPLLLVL